MDINTDKIFETFSLRAKELGCAVHINEPLSRHTSFRTGGNCRVLIEPLNCEQLEKTLALAKESNIPFIILGNGTNVLAPDDTLEKAVIKIGDAMSEISLEGDDTVCCTAGTKLITLCRFALEHSLSGLEFAYGIPGTCGGAVFMNAGAYGGEIKDVLTEATHITPDLRVETVNASELGLSYRHSSYKENGCIISGAKFKLKKADKSEIKTAMDDFLSRRKDKQPLEYASAGSTFKRPEGHFAGALIEQCGLKGASVGGAQVSEKHAGFVINKGGASSKDITDLIALVKNKVKSETGVELEPEVIILR